MTTPERPEKRRRSAPPPPTIIPEDLLLSEVLARLPVKSLARFKCVRRSWLAAIEHDPALVRRHLALSHAAAPPSLLVVPLKEFDDDDDDDQKKISFHRLTLSNAPGGAAAGVELVFRKAWPEGVSQQGAVPTHCDGLVAVAAAGDRVLVCNPATREFVALPRGSRDVGDGTPMPVALGYDPRRNRYVVARCFYRKCYVYEDAASGEDVTSLDCDVGHETFTLGGGRCAGWELTGDPPYAVAPATMPVCTAEAFYWCTAVGAVRPSKLLRFDLRDRAFEALPFPPGADFVHGADHLTELAGRPCYVRPATDTAFEFWVMAGGGGGVPTEWSLRCRVDFGDYGESVGCDAMLVVAAGAGAGGDEMVVAADHRELYRCDARRGSARRVVDMEKELEYERPDRDGRSTTDEYHGDLYLHHVVPYVESLVSIGRCNY
ncbi:unnamed protein product [Urochloa humidicola]